MKLAFWMGNHLRASPEEPMRRPYEKPPQTPVLLGPKRAMGTENWFLRFRVTFSVPGRRFGVRSAPVAPRKGKDVPRITPNYCNSLLF